MEEDKYFELNKTDSLERLYEFLELSDNLGKYYYGKKYKNGMFMGIFIVDKNDSTILEEFQFIKTNDEQYAKKVLAACVLKKMNLGVNEYEDSMENMKSFSGIFENLTKGLH